MGPPSLQKPSLWGAFPRCDVLPGSGAVRSGALLWSCRVSCCKVVLGSGVGQVLGHHVGVLSWSRVSQGQMVHQQTAWHQPAFLARARCPPSHYSCCLPCLLHRSLPELCPTAAGVAKPEVSIITVVPGALVAQQCGPALAQTALHIQGANTYLPQGQHGRPGHDLQPSWQLPL